jgi:hypothetical protein
MSNTIPTTGSTRQIISRSAKRKQSCENSYTEMVVYKYKLSNGKYQSQTRHEKRKTA